MFNSLSVHPIIDRRAVHHLTVKAPWIKHTEAALACIPFYSFSFTLAVRPHALRKEPPNGSHQQRATFSTPATRTRSGDLLFANALLAFQPGFRNVMDGRDIPFI
eukprot:1159703-Pelagomonas_calceolata.AAC.3